MLMLKKIKAHKLHSVTNQSDGPEVEIHRIDDHIRSGTARVMIVALVVFAGVIESEPRQRGCERRD